MYFTSLSRKPHIINCLPYQFSRLRFCILSITQKMVFSWSKFLRRYHIDNLRSGRPIHCSIYCGSQLPEHRVPHGRRAPGTASRCSGVFRISERSNPPFTSPVIPSFPSPFRSKPQGIRGRHSKSPSSGVWGEIPAKMVPFFA